MNYCSLLSDLETHGPGHELKQDNRESMGSVPMSHKLVPCDWVLQPINRLKRALRKWLTSLREATDPTPAFALSRVLLPLPPYIW